MKFTNAFTIFCSKTRATLAAVTSRQVDATTLAGLQSVAFILVDTVITFEFVAFLAFTHISTW